MQETANLVTFTQEILHGKLHFLCSEIPLEYFYCNKAVAKVLSQYFTAPKNYYKDNYYPKNFDLHVLCIGIRDK